MNILQFNNLVKKFDLAKDESGNKLEMHALAIKQDEQSFIHPFKNRSESSDIRSLSKTVLALVTGKVIELAEQGIYPKFSQDTLIFPIIKNVINLTNEDNRAYLEKIKIKDLLSHKIGYDKVLLMRGDIKNMDPYTYLDYLVNYPIKYDPGEFYLYSNAGFYLLSVVLQEFIAEDLFTFIERELFTPLGIENAHWTKYGNYLAGATRLWLQPQDLLNIGELLLNKGSFNDKQIISESWINNMINLKAKVTTIDPPGRKFLCHYGYGYGIWLTNTNIIFGSGTDGQFIVVVPDKNAIIVTQAVQKDTEPIKEIIDNIIANEL